MERCANDGDLMLGVNENLANPESQVAVVWNLAYSGLSTLDSSKSILKAFESDEITVFDSKSFTCQSLLRIPEMESKNMTTDALNPTKRLFPKSLTKDTYNACGSEEKESAPELHAARIHRAVLVIEEMHMKVNSTEYLLRITSCLGFRGSFFTWMNEIEIAIVIMLSFHITSPTFWEIEPTNARLERKGRIAAQRKEVTVHTSPTTSAISVEYRNLTLIALREKTSVMIGRIVEVKRMSHTLVTCMPKRAVSALV